MSLMDRVAAGLETLGKKANQALDEGKLRMELMRARRRMDGAARELGYVTYRQAKGEQPLEGQIESLTRRIAEAEAEAARLKEEIAKVRQPTEPPAGPGTKPEPTGG
jgi:chromosome segregation ATPase